MVMLRALLVALLVTAPQIASAQSAELEQAWRDWAVRHDILRTSIAIAEGGEITATRGYGMPADRVVPLASLSKAITGACILHLVDEGLLHPDDTMEEIFVDRPDLLAPGAPGAGVTVASLLTHTSGLWPDGTQNPLNPTLWFGGSDQDRLTSVGLSRPRAPEAFRYNNVNYAVLGSVIEVVSGAPVKDTCGEAVLSGIGSATEDRQLGGGLAWGGWAMTMPDYLRFFVSIDPTRQEPTFRVSGNVHYGPGFLHQQIGPRTVMWHSGALCLGRRGHSSLAIRLGDGTGAAVWVDRCMTADQLLDLDDVLSDVLLAD